MEELDFNEPRKTYSLRINAKLFEEISKYAKLNKRSIAKEIEYRLEQSLKTIR